MTEGKLVLLFIGAVVMSIGLLALVFGFFLGILGGKTKFEKAALLFLLGVAASTVGAWIMRIP
jgi:hypothetical protein